MAQGLRALLQHWAAAQKPARPSRVEPHSAPTGQWCHTWCDVAPVAIPRQNHQAVGRALSGVPNGLQAPRRLDVGRMLVAPGGSCLLAVRIPRHADGLDMPSWPHPAGCVTTPWRQGTLDLGEPTPTKTATADPGAVARVSPALRMAGQRPGRVVVMVGSGAERHAHGSWWSLTASRWSGAVVAVRAKQGAFFRMETWARCQVTIIPEDDTHVGVQVESLRVSRFGCARGMCSESTTRVHYVSVMPAGMATRSRASTWSFDCRSVLVLVPQAATRVGRHNAANCDVASSAEDDARSAR